MRLRLLAVLAVGGASLACGGAAGTSSGPDARGPAPGAGEHGRARRGGHKATEPVPAAPAVNPVAFHTYETDDGKYRVQFTSASHMQKTWSNMTGAPVQGSWTQSGDTVEVEYVPAEYHGSTAETFVTQGDCTLVRTARVDSTSGQRIEQILNYRLDDPHCR